MWEDRWGSKMCVCVGRGEGGVKSESNKNVTLHVA